MSVKFIVKGISLMVVNFVIQYYINSAVNSADRALLEAQKSGINTSNTEEMLLKYDTY